MAQPLRVEQTVDEVTAIVPTIPPSAIPHIRWARAILRSGFTVAPIVAGADKFFHWLVNWDQYLAPRIAQWLPVSGHAFMLLVGVIEIVAGLVVALRPRIGGYLVAAWLGGIIINLLLVPGYYDIALRDFGLMLGALALAHLSMALEEQT